MIIIEERLQEMFSKLPTINVDNENFAVSFDFGSHKDLLRFMNSEQKFQGGVSYPLIWLETPIEKTVFRNNHVNVSGLTLMLATLSGSEQSNSERLETTFKPTLIPLLKLVIETFKKSGFTQIVNKGEYKETFFYNYGVDEDEHITTDIWDVIKIELDVIIDGKCLRCINY